MLFLVHFVSRCLRLCRVVCRYATLCASRYLLRVVCFALSAARYLLRV